MRSFYMEARPMRRREREISDPAEIFAIARRCQVLRLALPDQDAPYVVPLSFGLEQVDGRLVFYVHCAEEGRKLELIGGGCPVGVELDRFLGYGSSGSSSTAYYESIIGRGRVEPVSGAAAVHGLELLLEHCGRESGGSFDACLPRTAVLRITLEECSAKAHPLPPGQTGEFPA
ncbi:MAG: pyridoxamine 5'-phosphate oxidase family protein [Firmicutes bacterium]|nr:pyridoxamine 5'-phosphate oxidase family protein [Bacillota bacterium]